MTKENSSKPRKARYISILLGLVFGVSFIGYIAYAEFVSDPTLTQVYFKFENGTGKWLDSETMVTFKLQNGTTVTMKVIDLAPIAYPEDFMAKTIHLKDGTIDYYFKHFDAIGSKNP